MLVMDKIRGMEKVLFDFGRLARTGLPEAVFCQNKPDAILRGLLEKFSGGEPPILFTRLAPETVRAMPAQLMAAYDYEPVSRTAFAARLAPKARGRVAVISAGSADSAVAGECARTLEYLSIGHTLFADCGISALWRITERLEQINAHDAIVVIAGMEGALPSVVGGLTPRPLFAVPTSVGYGVSQGGKAALAGMLASCAAGIGVLNIDNGYGAACAAARVVNLL